MKEILRAAIMDAFMSIPLKQHKKIRKRAISFGEVVIQETVFYFRGCFIAWDGYDCRFVD